MTRDLRCAQLVVGILAVLATSVVVGCKARSSESRVASIAATGEQSYLLIPERGGASVLVKECLQADAADLERLKSVRASDRPTGGDEYQATLDGACNSGKRRSVSVRIFANDLAVATVAMVADKDGVWVAEAQKDFKAELVDRRQGFEKALATLRELTNAALATDAEITTAAARLTDARRALAQTEARTRKVEQEAGATQAGSDLAAAEVWDDFTALRSQFEGLEGTFTALYVKLLIEAKLTSLSEAQAPLLYAAVRSTAADTLARVREPKVVSPVDFEGYVAGFVPIKPVRIKQATALESSVEVCQTECAATPLRVNVHHARVFTDGMELVGGGKWFVWDSFSSQGAAQTQKNLEASTHSVHYFDVSREAFTSNREVAEHLADVQRLVGLVDAESTVYDPGSVVNSYFGPYIFVRAGNRLFKLYKWPVRALDLRALFLKKMPAERWISGVDAGLRFESDGSAAMTLTPVRGSW
jgi:hypothetical protein